MSVLGLPCTVREIESPPLQSTIKVSRGTSDGVVSKPLRSNLHSIQPLSLNRDGVSITSMLKCYIDVCHFLLLRSEK